MTPASDLVLLSSLSPFPDILPFLLGLAATLALLFLWLWRSERNRADRIATESTALRTETDMLRETLETAQDGFHAWFTPGLDDADRSGQTDQADSGTALLRSDAGNRTGTDASPQPGIEHCSRRLAVLLRLPSGQNARFSEVIAGFADEDRARLTEAMQALRRDGDPFSLDLTRRGAGRRIHARGLRVSGWDDRHLADVIWMRDVTEDREVLEHLETHGSALATERDSLRALIDALPVSVWMRDEALALTDCNISHARALDLPDRSTALAAHREIADGVTGQEMRALAARSRAAGTSSTGRFHVVVGGERRLLDVTETPTDPAGPQPGHTVGLAYDLTVLEELESRLTRDSAAHRDVLERLSTAIAVFGSNETMTFYNTAFARLWDLDAEWLSQSPSYGAFLERLREDRRLPEVADFPAFKAGELKQFTKLMQPKEDILHLPDGTTLRRVIAPHPLGGLLTTYEDVTDNLALERSFNQLTAVQRETLDNLQEAVAVFGPNGELQLCNPPFTGLWELSPGRRADPGTSSEPSQTPADAARPSTTQIGDLVDRITQKSAPDHILDAEVFRRKALAPHDRREERSGRLHRDDGLYLDYTGVSLPDGGLLLSFLDVTDRVRVETALRERTDALRAAELLKGEFISNVSFELRTPLTTISGFSEILSGDYYGPLNARQAEYARVISETARQVAQLLDDITDLVSVEAGQLSLELDAFDIQAALATVLSLTRETAKRRSIAVQFDCPPDVGWLVADERRIKQILFHLMSNAVKFTDPGGHVTLAADRSETEVVFTVADSGRGMDPSLQSQSFHAFHKTSGADGAGLGLTLVRQFVDLHGGRLEVTSVPEEGTTVQVFIPAAAP